MSKFKALFDSPPTAKKREGKPQGSAAAKKPSEGKSAPKRGRPTGHAGGKRSNPNYTQITAYVRKDALADLKAKLLRDGKDMSDIVQAAFDEYLNT